MAPRFELFGALSKVKIFSARSQDSELSKIDLSIDVDRDQLSEKIFEICLRHRFTT